MCVMANQSLMHSFVAARMPPRVTRAIQTRALSTTEHSRYMHEIAMVSGDTKVDLLIKTLVAQGETIVSPEDRKGLMPLLIPITANTASSSTNPTYTCILRWPEGHKGMELPIVRMQRDGKTVHLAARSAEEYITRALVEEDADETSTSTTIAAAAGGDGLKLYTAGNYATSKLPSLNAYITKNVGMFTDVAEALALAHLKKGDTMSALITGEWYMRNHFSDWARPYEFNAWLMAEVGRPEESRDVARMSLTLPWWSLQNGFEAVRDTAGLVGMSADKVKEVLDEREEMASKQMRTASKTDKQERMDDAAHLLNKAAAGDCSWEEIKDGVSEAYMAAGLSDVARFVRW